MCWLSFLKLRTEPDERTNETNRSECSFVALFIESIISDRIASIFNSSSEISIAINLNINNYKNTHFQLDVANRVKCFQSEEKYEINVENQFHLIRCGEFDKFRIVNFQVVSDLWCVCARDSDFYFLQPFTNWCEIQLNCRNSRRSYYIHKDR